MRLSAALVACNENMKYLQFWPLVKKAWYEVVGIPCIMIYVADETPIILKNDPAVIHFKPAAGWSTATQAQVIRLLYPALLKADGAVIISDMDMIPMQPTFFHTKINEAADNQFVCLRGINETLKMIYMCYIAATPATFSSMFNIKQLDDIYTRFAQWSNEYVTDGLHDGVGWFSDQFILYKHVKEYPAENVHICPFIEIKEFPRLDRDNMLYWLQHNNILNEKLVSSTYIDFHMPFEQLFRPRITEIYNTISKFKTAPF